MRDAIIDSGQKIISKDLIMHLDAGQLRSYPGSGTSWTDLSGTGNNGTLTSGPTFSSGNGGSIVLDGTNDYIDLVDGFNNLGPSGVTLETWEYPTALQSYARTIDLNNGTFTDGVCVARSLDSQNLIFIVTSGSTQYYTDSTALSYPINAWQHWVCTANGTNFIIYKNGSQNKSSNNTQLPASGVTRANCWIGRSPFGDSYYKGNFAVVRLYNRALSSTEVLQNYNAEKSRFGL